MTTQRPYNEPLSLRKALRKCASAAGTHFDPSVIKALARFINKTTRTRPEPRVENQQEALQEISVNEIGPLGHWPQGGYGGSMGNS
jgi:HD-GYP domain-containing protein (c-di-GMP phosphodiesterase class II)